ncbi:MAG: hypothetical protein OXG74_13785 [Acidobacteria bacterium]|nr:hypothetical protein [Acidobacteriota bacterium]
MPPTLPDPDSWAEALKVLGLRERTADWLALVCRHGGVFTRRQFCDRYACRRNAAHRFVGRLARAGLAREYRRPGGRTNGTYCHIRDSSPYHVLGLGPQFARPPRSPTLLWRRLLGLDYVLERHDSDWLHTEEDLVAHFTHVGVRPGVLPKREFKGAVGKTVRRFPMRYPIDSDGWEWSTFVFVDPGYDTTVPLGYWADTHRRLWNGLRRRGIEVHVVAAVRSHAAAQRARNRLKHWTGYYSDAALTHDEWWLLEDIETAIDANDPSVFDEWGGFRRAMRLRAPLRRRADAADKGNGRIDSYSTHVAVRLGDPCVDARLY